VRNAASGCLCAKAADEIDRLRAEVKVWQGHTKTAVWSDSEECKMLTADNERLRAELQNHGQVDKLSEELERVKREAERAQDAHGVRFLNYLEETARLSDEVTRLRAALREVLSWHDYSNDMHKPIEVRAAYMRARAALGEKA